MILGIDEVGRGAWAGPLVVGAAVLGGAQIDGLTDSKLLSKKRREELNVEIYEKALGVGLGWVKPSEIDEAGLAQALRLGTRRAVEAIQKQHISFHEVIIDGTINFLAGTSLERFSRTLKKADMLIPSVSAASIVAKVARDHFMYEQAEQYPAYLFASSVGYGTAAHRRAIEQHGVTPLHRLSIAPLIKYNEPSKVIEKPTQSTSTPTTRTIGDMSEAAAAEELKRRGHEILERNWKTKWCEIDIISQKDDKLFFVEVKFRKNSQRGSGLDAITQAKLRQMKFASDIYVKKHNLIHIERQLMAISVSGETFSIDQVLEIL